MKFVPVDIEIPQSLLNTFKTICSSISINSKAIIAGGCLSDLYMGRPFQDVDIFCDEIYFPIEKVNQKLGSHFEEIDWNHEYGDVSRLFKGTAGDYDYDLVIVRNINRVLDFDIRFRQFYYYDGKVYASEGALQDIQKKQLTLLNVHSGIKTLARIETFKERYGFSMDSLNEHYLYSFINECNLTASNSIQYIRKLRKLSDNTKKTIESLITENTSKYGKIFFKRAHFPFHIAIKDLLFRYLKETDPSESHLTGLVGLHYEAMKSYKPLDLPANFSFEMDDADEIRAKNILLKEMKPVYEKHKLKYALRPRSEKTLERMEILWDEKTKYKEKFEILSKHFHDILEFYRQTNSTYFWDLQRRLEQSAIPKQSRFTISFEQDTDSNRFSDILCRNTFYVKITDDTNNSMALLMRKCTNGKFTISSVENPYQRMPSWIVLHSVMNQLAEKHPDWFEFGNKKLIGIFDWFSYSFGEFFFKDYNYGQHERRFRNLTLKDMNPIQIPISL